MDYPDVRRLDVHEQRQRAAQINAKLRELRSPTVLLADSLYMAGELGEPQWNTLHVFREDRLAFLDARSRGQVRKDLPPDARPRKAVGFSMRQTTIERALLVEREMPCDYFQYALYLAGFQSGRVEPAQAKHTAWLLAQIFDGRYRMVRWRDGRPDDCRTEAK